jgi:hypothetical protein
VLLHTRHRRKTGGPPSCRIKARARGSRELQSITAAQIRGAHAFFCDAEAPLKSDATVGAGRCCRNGRHNVAKWSIG